MRWIFAERNPRAERQAFLAADLRSVDERGRQSWEAKVQARRRALEDIERRQNRLVSQLESRDDPEGTLFGMVHERLRVLEGERKVRLDELRKLEDANPAGREQAPELLDLLPILDIDLQAVPADMSRRLFEASRLEIRYDKAAHRAVGRITLSDDSLEVVGPAAMARPGSTPSCVWMRHPMFSQAGTSWSGP